MLLPRWKTKAQRAQVSSARARGSWWWSQSEGQGEVQRVPSYSTKLQHVTGDSSVHWAEKQAPGSKHEWGYAEN